MGVKSGLKDVGRVLRVDFGELNRVTKKIDEILDIPSLKFKDLDDLKTSTDSNERSAWKEFNKIEKDNEELFRLARRFEGTPRNMGIHASGILVTPDPVDEIIPLRIAKDGTRVTMYTGVQLEDLGYIKFDILGLKTISVVKNALRMINEDLTFQDLYDNMELDDPKVFDMIQKKETDGLFQIESNLFKGMIEEIKPDSLNDIIVINSLGRPGPLSAGMDKAYARRKHGLEEAVEPLKNTWDITKDTLGTIAYQEQCMLISQRVAGFDGNQSDTYLRKALAKKSVEKMALCRQWLIYGKINEEAPEGYRAGNMNQVMYDPEGKYGRAIKGGINNGYVESKLIDFWNDLEGYAKYLFNLSHSACYSYITSMTAHLKRYYPLEFMTALLSMEDKEEKVEKYIDVANKMKLTIKVPDINLSGVAFTPLKNTILSGRGSVKEANEILFGLGAVKGVGDTSIPDIIANRPYENIADAISRIPKKSFNKRVGSALIKAGAFDFYNPNRYEVMNEFFDIRKDKCDRMDPNDFTDYVCAEEEKSVLGASVTHTPWWNEVEAKTTVEEVMELIDVSERTDKNGKIMGFLTLKCNGSVIKGIMFSSYYAKNLGALDKERNTHALIRGKKDDKGTLLVSKATSVSEEDLRLSKILA